MKEKKQAIYLVIAVGSIFFGLSLLCLIKGFVPNTYSHSERRLLAQLPRLSPEAVTAGRFAGEFETYSQDQFPFRETFRRLKARFSMEILGKKDNNGIYFTEGHLGKLDYPLNRQQLQYALEKIEKIYENWLEGKVKSCSLAVIPDKNAYLAEKNGYPSMDYEALYELVKENTSYLELIDIRYLLSQEDYYYTDIHWRQETLLPAAKEIAAALGHTLTGEYGVKTATKEFYGVLTGQSALKTEPDILRYLTNETLENCIVTHWDTGKPVRMSIYQEDKLSGTDAYDFFLSGAKALITIENPAAAGKGELIVFRDSFGSSLIPLLTEGYETITLVDIRYLSSDFLGEYIDFDGQEVLFLYSTMLLNNSLGLK